MGEIRIVENLLKANEAIAAENQRLFDEKGVVVINLMSSPGAGKTTLLERTFKERANQWRVGVIEGDVSTDLDAQRLKGFPIQLAQINTINLGGACHLDANMVKSALGHLELEKLELLIIENVGNLICPAGFALGEHERVVILSVAEGDDKPRKYPVMFRSADLLVVNKIDLLGQSDFDKERLRAGLRGINPRLPIIELSARTGEGFAQWVAWLDERVSSQGRD